MFWERWGEFFDARDVRAEDGKLRVVYVTEDTGVGGGHRDIFEHLNGLLERGHEVALYTLGEPPDWFDLRAPVRTFEFYDELVEALADLDAIKVATWWNTAAPVWRASVLRGIPVYFVQDIETSYYPDDEVGAPRGARLLPARVPLHDDLRLEPRPPARAGPRRRADPAGDRPRDLPPAPRRWRAATTWCSRSGAPTR